MSQIHARSSSFQSLQAVIAVLQGKEIQLTAAAD